MTMSKTHESQLALDLSLPPKMTKYDFLVTQSNQEAVRWITKWKEWVPSCLVLHGPRGCGKTHLASIWRELAHAKLLTPSDSVDQYIKDSQVYKAFVIEDIENFADETMLFHLFNLSQEYKNFLLLTADTPPGLWRFTLKDLKSRLQSALVVEIYPPDDSLLRALIVKQFNDRQLPIPPHVLEYSLKRIERSFEAVTDFVENVDRLSLISHGKITISLVRSLLEGDETLENNTKKRG